MLKRNKQSDKTGCLLIDYLRCYWMHSLGLHNFKEFNCNKKGYDPWSAAPFYTMNNGKSSMILIILKLD